MNIETIKEIEEQINYHLETYDTAVSEKNHDIAKKCIEVVESLLKSLDEDTINLRTDKVVH